MACGCTLMSGGVTKTCGPNQGGVKNIYLTDFCNITAYVDSSPAGIIESITMAGATVFYKFEFNRGTSTFAESKADDRNAGTVWSQTVTLVLSKRERTKREALALICQKDLAVIVQDNNDNFWVIGQENGAWATQIDSVSGTAAADPNNYTITLLAEEIAQAYPITEAAVLANI